MDCPNVQRVIKEAVDEDLQPAYVFEQNRSEERRVGKEC